jgi:hypothetical protein
LRKLHDTVLVLDLASKNLASEIDNGIANITQIRDVKSAAPHWYGQGEVVAGLDASGEVETIGARWGWPTQEVDSMQICEI